MQEKYAKGTRKTCFIFRLDCFYLHLEYTCSLPLREAGQMFAVFLELNMFFFAYCCNGVYFSKFPTNILVRGTQCLLSFKSEGALNDWGTL
jgi:hypothetical protein